ncbi:MAG: hypothetical protein J5J00_16740 [Deltaproteobacteria bacterium]|nr:hypothetical protein [Deltaproteobacteria bacterium]
MVSVRINGEDSSITGDGLPKVADLVELIKSVIDPDHMITGILIDGRDLAEDEWYSNVNQLGTSIIEVETGTPEEFVASRLSRASDIVRACYLEFRDARKSFQDGDLSTGNQKLATAVNTLKAYFEWYNTLLGLVPEQRRAAFEISDQVNALSETCKRICQQQLYQSWWALGESLEKDLEPKLDKLEDFCRKAAREGWIAQP